MQDFLAGKGLRPKLVPEGARLGRMIALVGDAELDEGNVYEALLESQKLGTKNNWWFIGEGCAVHRDYCATRLRARFLNRLA